MLETTDKTKIIKCAVDNYLHLYENYGDAFESNYYGKDKYIHLYLIDTDAEIKEGNWYINISMRTSNYGLHKYDSKRLETISKQFKGQFAVIITSTDKSLNISLLSDQSIKLAIDYFNKTSKKEVEVEVEYIDNGYEVDMEGIGGMDLGDTCWMEKLELKLNSEGKVDITIPEEKMYSRKQVKDLLHKCWLQASTKTLEPLTQNGFKIFIEENL